MRKKITSIIAIAALVVTMMPAMVFGATPVTVTDEASLRAAIVDGAEINVANSFSIGTTIVISGDVSVTINLNGNIIQSNTTDLFKVENGAELNIVGPGKLYTEGENCNIVWSKGDGTNTNTITLKDVTEAKTKSHAVIYHNGSKYGANVTIDNSKIISPEVAIFLSGMSTFGEDHKNKLTITDSTILSQTTCVEVKWGDVVIKDSTLTCSYSGTPSITTNSDGSSSAGYAVVIANNANEITNGTITIDGGTYTGEIGVQDSNTATAENNTDIDVLGGKFTDDVSNYVPSDMEQDEEGNVVEKEKPATDEDSDNTGSTTTEGAIAEGTIAEGTTTADTNAQTGDNTNLVFPAALIVLALGAMVAAKRRFN